MYTVLCIKCNYNVQFVISIDVCYIHATYGYLYSDFLNLLQSDHVTVPTVPLLGFLYTSQSFVNPYNMTRGLVQPLFGVVLSSYYEFLMFFIIIKFSRPFIYRILEDSWQQSNPNDQTSHHFGSSAFYVTWVVTYYHSWVQKVSALYCHNIKPILHSRDIRLNVLVYMSFIKIQTNIQIIIDSN